MKKIAMLLLCCLMLTACGSKKDSDASTGATATTVATTETTLPTEETTVSETTVPETTETVESILKVYSPDEALDGFVESEVTVDKIDETTIAEQLIAADVLTEGTVINTLALDGTHVNVDFSAEFRDLILTMGSSGERAVIGSVVNTILTAYNAETMTFTVDGEVLESGHVVYDFPLSFYE